MTRRLIEAFIVAAAALAAIAVPATAAAAQSPAVAAAQEAVENYKREEARSILEEACTGGDGEACIAFLAMLDGSYADGDQEAARSLASELCEKGDTLACITLARYAKDGDGGDIDQALQREILARICRSGIASSCSDAANMAGRGDGGAQDKALALEFARLGCEGGHAMSCQIAADYIGTLAWDAEGADAKDALMVDVRAAYTRGCALGDNYSCTQQADMMIKGEGGAVDRDGARALLAETCARDFYHCRAQLKAEAPSR